MKRSRPNTLEPISGALLLIVGLHLTAAFGAWWWWQDNRSKTLAAEQSRFAWMYVGDFKTEVVATPAITPAPRAANRSKAAKTPTPAPARIEEEPVQKATLVAAPPQQHQMEPAPAVPGTAPTSPLFAPATPAPKPSANRSITLRRAPDKPLASASPLSSPAPPISSPTLLDIARLNTLRPPPMPIAPGADLNAQPEAIMDKVDEAVNAAFLAGWTAPPIDSVPPGQREARLNISIGKDGTILKSQMSKFSGSHVLDQSILEAASHVKKISAALPSNFAKDSYDLELNFLLLP